MRDGYQPKGRGPIGPPPTGGSSARHPDDVAWRQQVAAWRAAYLTVRDEPFTRCADCEPGTMQCRVCRL
jgi:hypothetical protein